MKNSPYRKFAYMLIISFIIMYGVMFLNVADVDHIYFSLTRLYMTLLMVAPMSVLMPLMMSKMYRNKMTNNLIYISGITVFIAALFCLRTQAFISDRQYMQAMIPHHSSAIMTSRAATIKDPEVRALADGIIRSQEKEIAEMKEYLRKLK